jgi:peptidoglycan/LPS O-acetylase OafA/YrhL
MKKSIIVFIVSALVLISAGMWFVSRFPKSSLVDYFQFGIIILVVIFAIFLGYKRFTSVLRREPTEDELSKRINQKTASLSYYISLYLWLFLMYCSDKINYQTHTIIGAGILGMALTFGICWMVIKFIGLRNE